MSAVSFKLCLKEIEQVIEYVKQKIADKDYIVFLNGDLAAGKTTFVQIYTGAKGVTSPTFSLQNIYQNSVYHYDLYNCDYDKFMQTGLIYELEKEGIHFIEWGDEDLKRFCKNAGFNVLNIDINNLDDKREYVVDEA